MHYWQMTRKISLEQREEIAARALYRCEYCHLPRQDSLIQFHVDHIISLKHGGSSELNNLAYACPDCNYFKGSDIGSYSHEQGKFVRFFNPRIDEWSMHFEFKDAVIQPKTSIATVTVHIFQMNLPERIEVRKALISDQQYPS